jgi:hypothetical protein
MCSACNVAAAEQMLLQRRCRVAGKVAQLAAEAAAAASMLLLLLHELLLLLLGELS